MDKIVVSCSVCGFLGTFFITPEQHRDGAMVRAERLKRGHVCAWGETEIREV